MPPGVERSRDAIFAVDLSIKGDERPGTWENLLLAFEEGRMTQVHPLPRVRHGRAQGDGQDGEQDEEVRRFEKNALKPSTT